MRGTLVFDLDGTLAETAPDIMATLNILLKREGCRPFPPRKRANWWAQEPKR